MVILVPAPTCTTPAESASVASAFLQHRPNRPVLHLYFYNTGRIGQCCKIICTTPAESASVGKASFLIALGDAVALRHANTMPFLKTTQEAAAEGRRLLYRLLHRHGIGMSQSNCISQGN